MDNINYGAKVADLVCAGCALNVVIEILEHDEKSGEVYILEKVRDTITEGAGALDDLIYKKKNERH